MTTSEFKRSEAKWQLEDSFLDDVERWRGNERHFFLVEILNVPVSSALIFLIVLCHVKSSWNIFKERFHRDFCLLKISEFNWRNLLTYFLSLYFVWRKTIVFFSFLYSLEKEPSKNFPLNFFLRSTWYSQSASYLNGISGFFLSMPELAGNLIQQYLISKISVARANTFHRSPYRN